MKFPFIRYIGNQWDIEHIHSVNDEITDKKEWIKSYILTKDKENIRKEVVNILINDNNPKEETGEIEVKKKFNDEKELLKKLKEFNNEKDNDFFYYLKSCLGNCSTDNVENLALLDAGTNRSYGNAPFLIKRTKIKEEIVKGKYIPICTQNVFMKYYTNDVKNMSYWTDTDMKDYRNAIYEKLKEYGIKNTETEKGGE